MNRQVDPPELKDDKVRPDAEEEPAEHNSNEHGTRDTGAAERPAPEAWESVEQLFTLAPHLRVGRANVMGETRFGGDAVAGDKVVQHLHGTPSRLRVVGPIPGIELAYLADTFAPSRRYDELVARLAADRVLVLRGRPGTGRRTAALRMLIQAGPTDGEVIALDPGTEPADFADHIRPGQAHVVVDPAADADNSLRDVHLNAVRHRLGEHGLFVVVTSPATAVEDTAAYDWEPPTPADVVRAHLTHAILHSATGPWAPEEGSAIQRLLGLDATLQYLSSGPSPREAAGFARLLVEHAAGRCDEEGLLGYGRESAEQIVGALFGGSNGAPGGDALRDKAFLISLAVFDGAAYPLVADLGDGLYRLLRAVEEPERPAGHPIFGTSPAERLAWARAGEYENDTETPWGRVPERVVAFQNGSLWSTVLRHVWTSHPAVRRPVLDWLDSLTQDRRVVVRLRAAVAAGVLAATDFEYAFNEFLHRWGCSSVAMERQLAAWALYTAAEHGMDTAVRRLLSSWSGRRDTARRWTVARTYALLGGVSAVSALRDISRMAVTGPELDGALRTALEQTLETLLQGPAAATVLERLVQWIADHGPLHDLAAAAFLRGARRYQHESGVGGSWPRLLWLADREPRTRLDLIQMLRGLLGNHTTRAEAGEVLTRWVRAAELASQRAARTHEAVLSGNTAPAAVSDVEAALVRLFPALVATRNDRDRLDYLLRRAPGSPNGARSLTIVRLRAALSQEAAALPGRS
ncbi:hypothetical protein [Streptomyces nondiastaticus]|uniref:Uncharacterized protein n=1 Tax=Streptomyces nondiastaticus TaxID=3154512 RepID=A0ABW6U495_9ACTN